MFDIVNSPFPIGRASTCQPIASSHSRLRTNLFLLRTITGNIFIQLTIQLTCNSVFSRTIALNPHMNSLAVVSVQCWIHAKYALSDYCAMNANFGFFNVKNFAMYYIFDVPYAVVGKRTKSYCFMREYKHFYALNAILYEKTVFPLLWLTIFCQFRLIVVVSS